MLYKKLFIYFSIQEYQADFKNLIIFIIKFISFIRY